MKNLRKRQNYETMAPAKKKLLLEKTSGYRHEN